MKRSLWIATSLVALGFAGAAATRSYDMHDIAARIGLNHAQPPKQGQMSARPVLVTTVRADQSTSIISLPGVIAAGTEETRAFQVGGRLIERRVSLGDPVRRGDVLARLDDGDLRLALEAAEAEQAAATAAFDKARASLDRVTSLQSDGWVSTRVTDDTEVVFEEARGRLERAQSAKILARNNLDYSTILADADGLVTHEFAEEGQVVARGQPIIRIARNAGREAIVAVPEGMLADIHERRALVELWSQAGAGIPASLVELSPIADPATRTFEAHYRLEGEAAPALGLSATIRLTKLETEETTEVPLSALYYGADGPSVWTVGADGRLDSRSVAVTRIDAKTVRIASGISDGEQIVVIGTHKLSAGETVRSIRDEG